MVRATAFIIVYCGSLVITVLITLHRYFTMSTMQRAVEMLMTLTQFTIMDARVTPGSSYEWSMCQITAALGLMFVGGEAKFNISLFRTSTARKELPAFQALAKCCCSRLYGKSRLNHSVI